MKLCAMTMVHQDYWALGLWYAYYGAKLGYENLIIIEHGHDPAYRDLCPQAHFVTYPRDVSRQSFDADRYDFMDKIQQDLSARYDFIIRCDADELIVFDTEHYGSLQDVVTRCDGFMMATGIQIVDAGDAVTQGPTGQDISRLAVFDSRYSKAWVTDGTWRPRQHGVVAPKNTTFQLARHLMEGVYMLHLKYANAGAFVAQDIVRSAVTSREPDGRLVTMWGNDDIYLKKVSKYSRGAMRDFKILAQMARDHALNETPLMSKSGIFRVKRGFWKGPALLPPQVCKALA